MIHPLGCVYSSAKLRLLSVSFSTSSSRGQDFIYPLRANSDTSRSQVTPKMISRIPLGRNVQLCLQKSSRSSPIPSRGLAAAASGSFSYETGDASGVKYASRDLPGATTTLAVVAKAGTRYQPLPGFTEGLEKFAFKVSAALITHCTMSATLLFAMSKSLCHFSQPTDDLLFA